MLQGNSKFLSRFGWYLITGSILTVVGSWFFVKLVDELFEQELLNFDKITSQLIISFRTPWLNGVMNGITNFGSTVVVITIISSLTIIGFLYRRFLLDIFVLDLAVGGALGLTEFLKRAFHRPRPILPWLSSASGFSFPSGHALLTFSLYGFLAYIVFRNLVHSNWRMPITIGLLIIPLLVGVSRIYLGVHFPSDVLAGWTVAVAWLGTCIVGRETLRKAKT